MADTDMDEAAATAAAVVESLSNMGAKLFFEKPLTSSDTAGSGRVVIPKAIAEQYFPKLDNASGMAVDAVDPKGTTYTFKFRFWINNQSRMYLLEGAGALHRQYEMQVGDVMMFAQRGDGSLVVAGRPSTKADNIKRAPIRAPRANEPGSANQKREMKRPVKPTDKVLDMGGRRKRRMQFGGAGNDQDLEPSDGIFRAVASGLSEDLVSTGVSSTKDGRWLVSLNLSGEMYHAFFDSQDDATEAFNASGFAAAS